MSYKYSYSFRQILKVKYNKDRKKGIQEWYNPNKLYLICILQALQPNLDALLKLLSVSTEFTNLLAQSLDLQHLRQKLHFLCH